MVSEVEYDKNQTIYQKMISTQSSGTQQQSSSGMVWSADLAKMVPAGTEGPGAVPMDWTDLIPPIFPAGIVEKTAAKVVGAKAGVLVGEKALAKTSAIADREMIDAAASTVYNTIKNAGYSAAKAQSGSSQLAMILKTMRNRGSVDIAGAVNRATFLGLLRAGMEASPAGKLAVKTATAFAKNPIAAAPTLAQVAEKTSIFAKMLDKLSGKVVGGFVLGSAIMSPLTMLYNDFLKGSLGLAEARASAAQTMFVNGKLSREDYEKDIRDIGFSEPIENAYIATTLEEKRNIDYMNELGNTLGFPTLPTDTPYESAKQVEEYVRAQAEDQFKTQQKQSERASLGPYPDVSNQSGNIDLNQYANLQHDIYLQSQGKSPGIQSPMSQTLNPAIQESVLRPPGQPISQNPVIQSPANVTTEQSIQPQKTVSLPAPVNLPAPSTPEQASKQKTKIENGKQYMWNEQLKKWLEVF